MKYLLTLLVLSPILFFNCQAAENGQLSLFVKTESSSSDSISAIGTSVLFKNGSVVDNCCPFKWN